MMEKEEEVAAGRRRFVLTHPEKVLFPADGVTKRDLLSYYRRVSALMVPHLRGRPLMLHRFPDGLGAEGFYQKDIPDYFPDWIRRVEVTKADGMVTHVVCDDEATLAYLAAQACITPHPWLSRADRPERPDRVIFDLDPSGNDFDPVHLTTAIRKVKRKGRVFIDTLRNAYSQTAVAPYSVRALPGAPVATPLEWSELGDRRLVANRYNINNIPRRLGQRSDPWADIDQHARPLGPARAALGRLQHARAG